MQLRSLGFLAVFAAAACWDGPRPGGDRARENVNPKIVTSEPPPKLPTPKPPSEPVWPERPPGQPFRVEKGEKSFYDFPEGYDAEYDKDAAQRANAEFDLIMGSSNNPFGKHGAGADERDNPPNQPPDREPQDWGGAPSGGNAMPAGRITCRPRLALHRAASESSAVITRVPVGTKVRIIAHGDAKNRNTANWIQVDAGDNRRGWVLYDATSEVTAGEGGAAAYLTCCGVGRDAEDEASEARERFTERADYVSCLSRAVEAYGGGHQGGDLFLARAIALGRAAKLVQRTDKKLAVAYQTFMSRYGEQLDWDPEGYAMRAGDMWAAEAKYRGQHGAEDLAWTAAAYSAVPRTCGHEVACAVAHARASWGEYLSRYPNGAHAAEAMDAIAQLRPRGENDDRLQLDRNVERVQQCLTTLDSLSRIINGSQSVGRVQALGTVDGLRRFVLARSGTLQTTR